MPDEENATYYGNPVFQESLSNFQRGEWQDGLSKLDKLMEIYPLDHELRGFRQQMQLRSGVDQDEIEYHSKERIHKFKVWLVRLTISLVVLLVIA